MGIHFFEAADFRGVAGAAAIVHGVGVGSGGSLVCVTGRSVNPARGRHLEPERYTVWCQEGLSYRPIPLQPISLFPPLLIQPLPTGGVILCQRRTGLEPNAATFDAEGRVISQFAIGDGVAEMLVDSGGALWVSYFDEGILGGNQLSTSGLNRFDIGTGDVRWRLSSASLDVEDVYALNVGDASVWAYVFPAMELVRVEPDGSQRSWRASVEGARAIVVHGDEVVLVGSYEAPWAASAWQLGAKELEGGRKLLIERPNLPEVQLTARGPRLFAISDGLCLVADARGTGQPET